jgi:CheY-like chemotaxis protein
LSVYILVVDDEPDVEALFRQQFRRDLKSGRFMMEFAPSAPEALRRAAEIKDPLLILILSDINMPGMTGLEMLPEAKKAATRRARHHDYCLRRRRDQMAGDRARGRGIADQADRLRIAEGRNRPAACADRVTFQRLSGLGRRGGR